jgi:hypothetical protein
MDWMEIISQYLLGLLRQRNSIIVDNLALRQKLMVLKLVRPKPRFTELDRLFWVAYLKLIKGWQGFLEIASPRTVVGWGASAINYEGESIPATHSAPLEEVVH